MTRRTVLMYRDPHATIPTEINPTSANKHGIDLATGWPHPSLLPARPMKNAANAVLNDPELAEPAMLYGKDEGDKSLRENIARWLSAFYSSEDPLSYERICITGGASQNIACILQTFTDSIYTRNIWLVAPTYFLACRIFEDSGFASRLRAVPEDEEGINLSFLSQQLHRSEDDAQRANNIEPRLKPPRPWRKIYKHIIYCVPSFANPSGRIMSLSHRKDLVLLARKYDALIISDDVYDMLQWPSSPTESPAKLQHAYLPRLVDIDRTLPPTPTSPSSFGNTISNSSFSKLIGPGVRTGWTESTPALAHGLSQTGSTRSGGCPSQLAATFISQFFSYPDPDRPVPELSIHIFTTLNETYARRYYSLKQSINHHLAPLGVTTPQPDHPVAGGYFIWLTLPSSLDAQRLAQRCVDEENLRVTPGPKCRVTGDEERADVQFNNNVRLCFSYEDENLLAEGVERLAAVIRRELAG